MGLWRGLWCANLNVLSTVFFLSFEVPNRLKPVLEKPFIFTICTIITQQEIRNSYFFWHKLFILHVGGCNSCFIIYIT